VYASAVAFGLHEDIVGRPIGAQDDGKAGEPLPPHDGNLGLLPLAGSERNYGGKSVFDKVYRLDPAVCRLQVLPRLECDWFEMRPQQRAQVADEQGKVVLTIKFARLVFSEAVAAELSKTSHSKSPEADIMLIQRAKDTFARARKSHAEIRDGLDELRSQVRQLARYSNALGNGPV
jgi:hypothetical protein